MAVSIGSNLASLKAGRCLGQVMTTRSTVFERLSSGQRINQASDDAAGLAIASTLSINSRIYSQGIRNISDSISFFSVAEGAIGGLKQIVMRLKELASQSANGTYSDNQRKALNQELQTLGEEYNRVLSSASFNGRNVFLRSDGTFVTQAGGSMVISSQDSSRATSLDSIARATTGTGGSAANASSTSSTGGDVSSDGRYVVFQSSASNLVADDTNGLADIFVKDLQTGVIQRVSTSSTGGQSNGVSDAAAISADGRCVIFHSSATNLVANDSNGTDDVFVKDLQTGETRRVSISTSAAEGNAASYAGFLSADGRYAVFMSNASNLISGDNNASADIFVKDLQTGELRRASTSSTGVESNAHNFAGSISADGRYVAFQTFANNLVDGDTNSALDIFVKDLLTGDTRRVSTDSSGTQSNGHSLAPIITADGRYVAFTSSATNLVGNDTNSANDVFRKDLLTGETIRVSTTSANAQVNGASTNATISNDGRYIVFDSLASNLVSGDTNARKDVFVKDMLTGDVRRLSISETGREPTLSWNNQGSLNASISADGRYVFFQSDFRDLLDGSTTGNIYSLYSTANPLAEQHQLTHLQWINTLSQQESRNALSWLESYENELNVYQGKLGSTMSRLGTAAQVLSQTRENTLAAEARIMDADIASESLELVRTQIVQQASQSVLAQANLQPRIALDLLRNA